MSERPDHNKRSHRLIQPTKTGVLAGRFYLQYLERQPTVIDIPQNFLRRLFPLPPVSHTPFVVRQNTQFEVFSPAWFMIPIRHRNPVTRNNVRLLLVIVLR